MRGAAMTDMRTSPVPMVYPDTRPARVAFYFPGESLHKCFAGQRDNWYGVCRAFMTPGRSFVIVFCHEGDPAGVRLHAMDGNPLSGVVQSRIELRPARTGLVLGPWPAYDVAVRLPARACTSYVYLVLEWQAPPGGVNRPLTVSVQVVSITPRLGRETTATSSGCAALDAMKPARPPSLRQPVELPFPVWTESR